MMVPSDEWVVVRTAPNQMQAEIWAELLDNQAIPARLAPADVVSFLGVSSAPCRVLVPAHRVAEAREILQDDD